MVTLIVRLARKRFPTRGRDIGGFDGWRPERRLVLAVNLDEGSRR